MRLDAGDRLLFALADASGMSIDRLYRMGAVRFCMTLVRKVSSIRDMSPR